MYWSTILLTFVLFLSIWIKTARLSVVSMVYALCITFLLYTLRMRNSLIKVALRILAIASAATIVGDNILTIHFFPKLEKMGFVVVDYKHFYTCIATLDLWILLVIVLFTVVSRRENRSGNVLNYNERVVFSMNEYCVTLCLAFLPMISMLNYIPLVLFYYCFGKKDLTLRKKKFFFTLLSTAFCTHNIMWNIYRMNYAAHPELVPRALLYVFECTGVIQLIDLPHALFAIPQIFIALAMLSTGFVIQPKSIDDGEDDGGIVSTEVSTSDEVHSMTEPLLGENTEDHHQPISRSLSMSSPVQITLSSKMSQSIRHLFTNPSQTRSEAASESVMDAAETMSVVSAAAAAVDDVVVSQGESVVHSPPEGRTFMEGVGEWRILLFSKPILFSVYYLVNLIFLLCYPIITSVVSMIILMLDVSSTQSSDKLITLFHLNKWFKDKQISSRDESQFKRVNEQIHAKRFLVPSHSLRVIMFIMIQLTHLLSLIGSLSDSLSKPTPQAIKWITYVFGGRVGHSYSHDRYILFIPALFNFISLRVYAYLDPSCIIRLSLHSHAQSAVHHNSHPNTTSQDAHRPNGLIQTLLCLYTFLRPILMMCSISMASLYSKNIPNLVICFLCLLSECMNLNLLCIVVASLTVGGRVLCAFLFDESRNDTQLFRILGLKGCYSSDVIESIQVTTIANISIPTIILFLEILQRCIVCYRSHSSIRNPLFSRISVKWRLFLMNISFCVYAGLSLVLLLLDVPNLINSVYLLGTVSVIMQYVTHSPSLLLSPSSTKKKKSRDRPIRLSKLHFWFAVQLTLSLLVPFTVFVHYYFPHWLEPFPPFIQPIELGFYLSDTKEDLDVTNGRIFSYCFPKMVFPLLLLTLSNVYNSFCQSMQEPSLQSLDNPLTQRIGSSPSYSHRQSLSHPVRGMLVTEHNRHAFDTPLNSRKLETVYESPPMSRVPLTETSTAAATAIAATTSSSLSPAMDESSRLGTFDSAVLGEESMSESDKQETARLTQPIISTLGHSVFVVFLFLSLSNYPSVFSLIIYTGVLWSISIRPHSMSNIYRLIVCPASIMLLIQYISLTSLTHSLPSGLRMFLEILGISPTTHHDLPKVSLVLFSAEWNSIVAFVLSLTKTTMLIISVSLIGYAISHSIVHFPHSFVVSLIHVLTSIQYVDKPSSKRKRNGFSSMLFSSFVVLKIWIVTAINRTVLLLLKNLDRIVYCFILLNATIASGMDCVDSLLNACVLMFLMLPKSPRLKFVRYFLTIASVVEFAVLCLQPIRLFPALARLPPKLQHYLLLTPSFPSAFLRFDILTVFFLFVHHSLANSLSHSLVSLIHSETMSINKSVQNSLQFMKSVVDSSSVVQSRGSVSMTESIADSMSESMSESANESLAGPTQPTVNDAAILYARMIVKSDRFFRKIIFSLSFVSDFLFLLSCAIIALFVPSLMMFGLMGFSLYLVAHTAFDRHQKLKKVILFRLFLCIVVLGIAVFQLPFISDLTSPSYWGVNLFLTSIAIRKFIMFEYPNMSMCIVEIPDASKSVGMCDRYNSVNGMVMFGIISVVVYIYKSYLEIEEETPLDRSMSNEFKKHRFDALFFGLNKHMMQLKDGIHSLEMKIVKKFHQTVKRVERVNSITSNLLKSGDSVMNAPEAVTLSHIHSYGVTASFTVSAFDRMDELSGFVVGTELLMNDDTEHNQVNESATDGEQDTYIEFFYPVSASGSVVLVSSDADGSKSFSLNLRVLKPNSRYELKIRCVYDSFLCSEFVGVSLTTPPLSIPHTEMTSNVECSIQQFDSREGMELLGNGVPSTLSLNKQTGEVHVSGLDGTNSLAISTNRISDLFYMSTQKQSDSNEEADTLHSPHSHGVRSEMGFEEEMTESLTHSLTHLLSESERIGFGMAYYDECHIVHYLVVENTQSDNMTPLAKLYRSLRKMVPFEASSTPFFVPPVPRRSLILSRVYLFIKSLFQLPVEYDKIKRSLKAFHLVISVLILLLFFIRGDVVSSICVLWLLLSGMTSTFLLSGKFMRGLMIVLYVSLFIKLFVNSPNVCQSADPKSGQWIVFYDPYCDSVQSTVSFQTAFIFSFFKTNSQYKHPIGSSIIWDVLLIMVMLGYDRLVHALSMHSLSDKELMDEVEKHSQTVSGASGESVAPPLDLIRSPLISRNSSNDNPSSSECVLHSGVNFYIKMMVVQLISFVYSLFFISNAIHWNVSKFANDLSKNQIRNDSVFFAVSSIIIIIILKFIFAKRNIRALYILHCTHIIAVVIFFVLYVPLSSQRNWQNNVNAMIYVLIQLVYSILSALQIHHGFYSPMTQLNSRISEDFSFMGYVITKTISSIPFLGELNTLIEWVSTPTSLTLTNSFIVEGYHKLLYLNQYNTTLSRSDKNTVLKLHRPQKEKILNGFSFIIAIVLLLMIPLLLFSSGSLVLVPNPIESADISLDLHTSNRTFPLFAFNNIYSIRSIDSNEFDEWRRVFSVETKDHNNRMSLLNENWKHSSQVVTVSPNAIENWSISRFARIELIEELANVCVEVSVEMNVKMYRKLPENIEEASGKYTQVLAHSECSSLAHLLNDDTSDRVVLHHFFPRLFYLSSSNEINRFDKDNSHFNSIAFSLHHSRNESFVWGVRSSNATNLEMINDKLELWVVNDPMLSSLIASSLGSFGEVGIVGLYVTILVTFGSLIRAFFTPQVHLVPLNYLPDSTLLLSLIHSILICRSIPYKHQSKDEKRLFELLIHIFRSSDSLIHLSKEKPMANAIVPQRYLNDGE